MKPVCTDAFDGEAHVSADAMAHIEGSFYVGAEDGCEERPACCKY
jgi:hypothetical protein